MKRWLPLILLSGCMVGPDYHTPEVTLPCHYEQAPVEKEEVNLTSWWEQFEDFELNEYIETALVCNLDLQIALHRIEEFRNLYRIDRSALYPQINANMVATRSRFSENISGEPIESTLTPAEFFPGVGGSTLQNFFQIGFDASWELDLFGKNRRTAEAGLADFEASQEEALFTQVTLVSDVARSYVDIRSLQQRVFIKKEQIKRQEELLELAQARYCAGISSYLDVTRAAKELKTQQSTLPPLEEELQVTTHALAILLGKAPENFCICEGKMPKAQRRVPGGLPSDLLCRRPDIRKVERELAAATARIGIARAELFPTFSLTGSFGTQANELGKLLLWPSRFWSVGPSMVWNLFSGGKLVTQVQVQNERQKQALLRYEKVILTALKEVEDRLTGYYKEQSRFTTLQTRIETQTLALELVFDQYIHGLISLDEVLDAEKDLFESKEEAIQSEGIMMVHLVGLYKALGGGWKCSDLL